MKDAVSEVRGWKLLGMRCLLSTRPGTNCCCSCRSLWPLFPFIPIRTRHPFLDVREREREGEKSTFQTWRTMSIIPRPEVDLSFHNDVFEHATWMNKKGRKYSGCCWSLLQTMVQFTVTEFVETKNRISITHTFRSRGKGRKLLLMLLSGTRDAACKDLQQMLTSRLASPFLSPPVLFPSSLPDSIRKQRM